MDEEFREKERREKYAREAKGKLDKLEDTMGKLNRMKGDLGRELGKLKENTLCDYCGKALRSAVTNIPCGHNYCQECKSGYLKECKKCPGTKREAVYRNELMD